MEIFDIIVDYLKTAGLSYRQSVFLVGQLLWEERSLIGEENNNDIIETNQKKGL